MMKLETRSSQSAMTIRRAFTLAEVIVPGVLIAILIVAGRVFNTAQQVSNVGAATADVMQEAVAIERQIRDDIARMSPSGVLAIHSVSVRNDQPHPRLGWSGPRPADQPRQHQRRRSHPLRSARLPHRRHQSHQATGQRRVSHSRPE